jgi:hypothetical protein
VLSDDGVLHRNMQELFNVNFNANFKLFLRLSNCVSVGEENFDNYQDARYVCGKKNISQTYLDDLKNYVMSSLPSPLKNKYFTYEYRRSLYYQMILNHFY